ncbi:MAG: viroplasmin family protein [Bacteroidota bacterium]|nr:viroplasmin family protein [Bacteroidota bacterium]
MARQQKYYVVWKGHHPGIYSDWKECELQIQGFEGAQYKSFPDRESAIEAYRLGVSGFYKSIAKSASNFTSSSKEPILTSLCVDAACSGNPGAMEYRGVMTANKQEIFRIGPFPLGTNNIGEFLAIVHGLALLKKQGSDIPIYSDSINALGWVKKKAARTKLPRNEKTEQLFQLIDRAQAWLKNNTYSNPLLKWETERWGEIPADFGRK